MFATTAPSTTPEYDITALKTDYPGIRNGPFADALRAPSSALRRALSALKNSVVLPSFTAEQFVAAILLMDSKRYLTREEIFTKFIGLPAVEPWADLAHMIFSLPEKYLVEKEWKAPVVRALKSVHEFLEREEKEGGMEFALADALDAPEWIYRREEQDEEKDTEMPRPYNYDYGDGAWFETYQEERDACSPNLETLGIDEHICALKTGKENGVFANLLCSEGETPSKDVPAFPRWAELPIELKAIVLEHTYVYPQKLKITAKTRSVGSEPETHVEELTNVKYSFQITAKTPRGLVSIGHPRHVLAFRLVGKDYAQIATELFFGKNTFEIHDASPSLRRSTRTKVVAHRWLEYLDRHGLLQYFRKLNIDINLEAGHQHKWHVNRTFAALVSVKWLERLVIDLEMECLIFFREFDEDISFYESPAECYPREWPGPRMLPWAESARVKPGRKANKILRVYIPKNRKAERSVKEWMKKADDDHDKFYSAADWEVPEEGFATPNIDAAMANVRSRQFPEQEWVSWDEGSEDVSGMIEYDVDPDSPYYDDDGMVISRVKST